MVVSIYYLSLELFVLLKGLFERPFCGRPGSVMVKADAYRSARRCRRIRESSNRARNYKKLQ